MKIAIRMLVEKYAIDRVLCRLQMRGDAGTFFATLSASIFHTPSLYYMRNVTCCVLISSWQQCIVVSPYTAPVFSAVLPNWHDVRKKTSKICTPPRNINSRVARSKSTDVAAMVMEERQVKYWELTDCSLWVVGQLCETFLHPCTVRYHSAVWNLGVELTLYFNLYELTAWLQRCMLEKNWMNGHNGNFF